jgi:ABC-2 type transport system permease protein
MSKIVILVKEFREIFKSYKLIVLPLLFVTVGVLSPVMAKMMPQILKSIMGAGAISLPTPGIRDSYEQLLKNMNQTLVLVLILSTMNVVVEEKLNGSLILVLTKPISRANYILSKFISQLFLVLISLGAGAAVFAYYSSVIFNRFDYYEFIVAMFFYFLYVMCFVSMAIFFSTISPNVTISAILSFVGYTLINLTSFVAEKIAYFTPAVLSSQESVVLSRGVYALESYNPAYSSIILIAVFLIMSILSLRYQEF